MSDTQKVMVYEYVHCPFCGETDLMYATETFNYKAGFWGAIFLHWIGGLIFGFLGHKRIECLCNNCGGQFSFTEDEIA